MVSCTMPLAQYQRYGGASEMIVKEKAQIPGPGHYTSYPIINPATHQMGDAHYFPDRKLTYPGAQAYSQQPFYLSLPTKEQNRLWHHYRTKADKKKRQEFLAKAGTAFQDKDALEEATKDIDHLVYTNRDLPMSSFARYPKDLGNWSMLKHVKSEPVFPMYETGNLASTMSFHDRLEHKRSFLLHNGKKKFRHSILQANQGKRIGNLISLMTENKRRDEEAKRKVIKDDIKGWYIPPLPKEEGLGEYLSNASISFHTKYSRSRSVDENVKKIRDQHV